MTGGHPDPDKTGHVTKDIQVTGCLYILTTIIIIIDDR